MKGEANVVTLHINDVLPNRFQPRIKFNENKIGELAESIRKYGVIQPIIVRQIGDKYEIIAGERRYKASVLAGQETIPAIINNLDDKDSSEVALIENVQRENLTPIEEAISYKKILDMGYLTQENLATKLGLSQSAVANKLRLLHLSDIVQEALLENKISERHARSLLKLKKEEEQRKMLDRIIKERLTVRKTDEEIEKLLHNKKSSEEKKENDVPTAEEIEILNILNTYKEEKELREKKENTNHEKERIDMNPNDPMNQFDIPEVNIINDSPKEENSAPIQNASLPPVEPKVDPTEPIVLPNVGPVLPSEPSTISPIIEDTKPTEEVRDVSNPGFMDIDRIQREAVDIAQKEPAAPMVNLLEPDASMKPVNEATVETPAIPKGKFFDVMPSMQEAMTVEQESPSTPSMFGTDSSIFGNYSNNTTTTPNNMDQSNSTDSGIDTFSSILVDPVIQPINVPTVEPPHSEPAPSNPTTFVPSEPSYENPTTINSPLLTPEPVQTPIENPIEAPVGPIPTPLVENPTIDEVSKVEIPEINLGNTPDIPSIEPIQIPTPPIEAPASPSIVEPPVVENPNSTSINDISPIVNSQESPASVLPLSKPTPVTLLTTPNPYDISTPLPPEPVSSPEPVSLQTAPENIRKAISVIRNATDELSKLGFIVDTDEMDLENIYQVIIKINK